MFPFGVLYWGNSYFRGLRPCSSQHRLGPQPKGQWMQCSFYLALTSNTCIATAIPSWTNDKMTSAQDPKQPLAQRGK